jgi:hypothetical protein
MANNVIPCRRPKVTAERLDSGLFRHACHVPGCGWTFTSVKSAQEAGWHRADHRAAVPDTKVYLLPAGPNFEHRGYMAECACGWYREAPGVTSRGDNEAALTYHLTHDHGLVTCP